MLKLHPKPRYQPKAVSLSDPDPDPTPDTLTLPSSSVKYAPIPAMAYGSNPCMGSLPTTPSVTGMIVRSMSALADPPVVVTDTDLFGFVYPTPNSTPKFLSKK